MKKLNIREIPLQLILIIFFVLGFVAGTFTVGLKTDSILLNPDVYSPDFFNKLKNITMDKRVIFFISLGKQLRNFLLIIFLSASVFRSFIIYAYTALQGFFIGSSLEMLMILYGISGIRIYSLLSMPQGFFYFLSYSILLIQVMKEKGRERKKKLFISFILLVIGSVMEAYCNLFALIYLTDR